MCFRSDQLTRSASGSPDYRDAILRSAERATNDIMKICSSAAEHLTLDL